MRIRTGLIGLVAVFPSLLAACADDGPMIDDRPPTAPPAIEADFLCGGERVHTRFWSERMMLTIGEKRYLLDQARSGSGARYTGSSPDGPVAFWNKGREARLTVGDHTYPVCKQQGETR